MPPPRGADPKELTLSGLKGFFSSSNEDAVRTLIHSVSIPPLLCEEILSLAGTEKSAKAKTLAKEKVEKIFKKIRQFYSPSALASGEKIRPVLLEKKGKKTLMPFSLKSQKEFELREFESVNSALDECFSLSEKKKPKGKKPQKSKASSLERTLEMQKAALEEANAKALLNRQRGEAVYSRYSEINPLFEDAKKKIRSKEPKKDVMYNLAKRHKMFKKLDYKKKRLQIDLT